MGYVLKKIQWLVDAVVGADSLQDFLSCSALKSSVKMTTWWQMET
jgi:hypothetical protein